MKKYINLHDCKTCVKTRLSSSSIFAATSPSGPITEETWGNKTAGL